MNTHINDALQALLEIPEGERDADVHIMIAALATTLAHYGLADSALNAVAASQPDHPELKRERAKWLLEVGHVAACIDFCKLTLLETPQDVVLTTILMDGLFFDDNFEEVAQTYAHFSGMRSLEMAVIATRGMIRLEQPRRAIEILDSHLNIDAVMPDAHYLRAQLAFFENDIDRAITHLERACTLLPTFLDAVNQLIHSYLELDQWDKAIPWIAQMIERNPLDPEQHFRLAVAYEGLSQIDKALMSIDKAIALDPDSVELHCAKIGFWVRSGNVKEAMAPLKALVDSKTKNPIVFQMLGVAFQYQNRWENSIKALKKALELGGEDPIIYGTMATAYLALGQNQLAKESFQSAAKAGGGEDFALAASQIVIQSL